MVSVFLEGDHFERWAMDHPHLEEQVSMAIQLAQQLQKLHETGIVHRDIKPDNIRVSQGKPYIMDYGLARKLALGDHLREEGRLVGTPLYMSRASLNSTKTTDHRVDVYGLGCTLYELFTKEQWVDRVQRHKKEPPSHSINDIIHLQETLQAGLVMESLKDKIQDPTLRSVLAGMLHPDAEKRINLATAIERLRTLQRRLADARHKNKDYDDATHYREQHRRTKQPRPHDDQPPYKPFTAA